MWTPSALPLSHLDFVYCIMQPRLFLFTGQGWNGKWHELSWRWDGGEIIVALCGGGMRGILRIYSNISISPLASSYSPYFSFQTRRSAQTRFPVSLLVFTPICNLISIPFHLPMGNWRWRICLIMWHVKHLSEGLERVYWRGDDQNEGGGLVGILVSEGFKKKETTTISIGSRIWIETLWISTKTWWNSSHISAALVIVIEIRSAHWIASC